MKPGNFLRKKKAISIRCPTCEAPSGSPCIRKDGTQRVAVHAERYRYSQVKMGGQYE